MITFFCLDFFFDPIESVFKLNWLFHLYIFTQKTLKYFFLFSFFLNYSFYICIFFPTNCMCVCNIFIKYIYNLYYIYILYKGKEQQQQIYITHIKRISRQIGLFYSSSSSFLPWKWSLILSIKKIFYYNEVTNWSDMFAFEMPVADLTPLFAKITITVCFVYTLSMQCIYIPT